MTTYRDVITSYSQLVVDGHADQDLETGQRHLLGRLLRAVAAPPIVTATDIGALDRPYALVADHDRDVAVDILFRFVGRTYALPSDYDTDMLGWDRTVQRAAQVLRAI